jgi:hypothetical protein
LGIGGLDTRTDEHIRWPDPPEIKVGDTITVEVVETDTVDTPTDRKTPAQLREEERVFLTEMEAEHQARILRKIDEELPPFRAPWELEQRQAEMPNDNESWIVEEGDRVIRKRTEVGGDSLAPWEALVYALWWADYAMRNGESLTAANANCGFQANGLRAAKQLSLPLAQELFALDLDRFEKEYLDRFEAVCDEVRAAR